MSYNRIKSMLGRKTFQNRPPLAIEQQNWQGVNYVDEPALLQSGQVPYAKNVDFGDPIGAAKKRDGLENLFASLGAGRILGLHGWKHSTGDILLAAHGTKLYRLGSASGSVVKTTQGDWEAGLLTQVEATSAPGDVKLAKRKFSETDTLTADFNGTHSNTVAVNNAVVLAKTAAGADKYGITALPSITSGSSTVSYERGRKFTVGASDVIARKLRIYAPNSTQRTLRLWRCSDGTKLAEVAVTTSANAWVEGAITNVTLQAGQDYIVSYDAPANVLFYRGAEGAFTFNAAMTSLGGFSSSTVGQMPDTDDTNIYGIIDIVFADAVYQSSGTYTHGEQDVSAAGTCASAIITYSRTTPANTTATVQTRVFDGTAWSAWANTASGGALIPAGTNLTGYKVQWRVNHATTDTAATPTLNDVTVEVVGSYYTSGEWRSKALPAIDLGNTPATSTLAWVNTVPANTSVTWYARGSSDGAIWGAWQEIAASGNSLPLNRYLWIKFEMTSSAFDATPTVSEFTISYTMPAGAVTEININTVSGRVAMTGNKVRFADYPPHDHCIIVDGGRPLIAYLDGITVKVRDAGVDPPAAAPTIAAGAGTGLTGDYYAKVTFVNSDGVEGNPSPASTKLTVANKNIEWSSIPVGPAGTAKRRLYRTAAGGAVYKFLAEINNNTATTYTDNIADASLGDLMQDNNNVPPNAVNVYEYQNYIFYVKALAETQAWFSKVGEPEQVPNISGDRYYKEFAYPVSGVHSAISALVIGGKNFCSSIVSNTGLILDSNPTIDTSVIKTVDKGGPLSQEAMALCTDTELRTVLLFPTSSGIRFLVPGYQEQSLEAVPLSRNVQPYFDRASRREDMAAIFYDNRYIISFAHQEPGAVPVAANNVTFIYDFRSKQWYGPWNVGLSRFAVANNELYAGDAAIGRVYRMFSGATHDNGADIEMVLDLPRISPQGEHFKYRVRRFLVIVSADSVTTDTVVRVKIDDREAEIPLNSIVSTFVGDERPGHNTKRSRKYPIPLPPGHAFSVRIVDASSNPLTVQKVTCEYERLQTRR